MAKVSAPDLPARRLGSLRATLLEWAEVNGRDLPWRRTRDPWAVLVSEVMLQQTQVSRVLERYGPFLARFPTPTACAAASAAEVVREWAGLGYNRRALGLRRAAAEIDARHGGRVPDDPEDLRALAGIGPYTARAVLAFAFEQDVGVVDTNVARLCARALSGRSLRAAETQGLADRLVPSGNGWAFGQAMLDLGALVCRARDPRCDVCPWRRTCRWRRAGLPSPDPARATAGTARPQGRFEGSHRQGRGRLLDALRQGPVSRRALPGAAGWPGDPERSLGAAEQLVREGFACWRGATLVLC